MLCPGCFREKGEAAVCPYRDCGWNANADQGRTVLPYFTPLLAGRYLTGRALGKGGFGVTYAALDRKRNWLVAIKEFLPDDIADRGQSGRRVVCRSRSAGEDFAFWLEKFKEEAITLYRLNERAPHPNLARVWKYFPENGTGYMVMQYYRGMTLGDHLKRQGRLSEAEALAVMRPIMDGLRAMHGAGVVHRDVKPANICLADDMRRPVLLDFGAARPARRRPGEGYTRVLTEGYAPIEQYSREEPQGDWTDVYACAATLYHMVSGRPPLAARRRTQGDDLLPLSRAVPGVSAAFGEAVRRGMAVHPRERPQTMAEFLSLLPEAAQPTPLPKPTPPGGALPPLVGPGGPGGTVPPGGGRGTGPRPPGDDRQWPPEGEPRRPARKRQGPTPIQWAIIVAAAVIVATVLGLALTSLLQRLL